MGWLAQVRVTNSNSSVKDTEYMVKAERVGALRFTDTTGGDHSMVRQHVVVALIGCVTA